MLNMNPFDLQPTHDVAAALSLARAHGVPRLDAELVLADRLGLSRTRIMAFTETKLGVHANACALALARLASAEPVAYVLGFKEFFGLRLAVTPAVLVPRPETEHLVECLLARLPEGPARLADLGTGSGALALALAHARPAWEIHAVELSPAALAVAQANASAHQLQVSWHLGSWCEPLPDLPFDAIASNPPYLAAADPHRFALRHEPTLALIAGPGGHEQLDLIALQARAKLRAGGWLALEHGCTQGASVRLRLCQLGYQNVASLRDYAGHERVSFGQRGSRQENSGQ